jgi:hypothetical protein
VRGIQRRIRPSDFWLTVGAGSTWNKELAEASHEFKNVPNTFSFGLAGWAAGSVFFELCAWWLRAKTGWRWDRNYAVARFTPT